MCHCGYARAESRCNKCGTYTESPNILPSMMKPHYNSAGTKNHLTLSYDGIPSQDNCTGEGLQQFIAMLSCPTLCHSLSPMGPGAKNDRTGGASSNLSDPTWPDRRRRISLKTRQDMVIIPAGSETKNDFIGEDQQQLTRNPRQRRAVVNSSSQSHPLVKEEAPFQNT
jgi:hypothetical protein